MSISRIHYKFKSQKDISSISFEGLQISVANLKRKIIEKNKLESSGATDFELLITNPQTQKEYYDENVLLPRNTTLVVKRVPLAMYIKRERRRMNPQSSRSIQSQPKKHTSPATSVRQIPSIIDPQGSRYNPADTKVESKATSPEDSQNQDAGGNSTSKLTSTQSSGATWTRPVERRSSENLTQQGNKPSDGYATYSGNQFISGRTPPPSYICHRCGERGHYINQCPTNTDPNYDFTRYRKPVGIPKSFLVATDSSRNEAGTMIMPGGTYAYAKPRESVFNEEVSKLKRRKVIPDQFICPLCKKVLTDAVLITCCGKSFCAACMCTHMQFIHLNNPLGITKEVEKSQKCPECGKKCTIDNIYPNTALRKTVETFLLENVGEANELSQAPPSSVLEGDQKPAEAENVETSQELAEKDSTSVVNGDGLENASKELTMEGEKVEKISKTAESRSSSSERESSRGPEERDKSRRSSSSSSRAKGSSRDVRSSRKERHTRDEKGKSSQGGRHGSRSSVSGSNRRKRKR